jgi:hypothetical protein
MTARQALLVISTFSFLQHTKLFNILTLRKKTGIVGMKTMLRRTMLPTFRQCSVAFFDCQMKPGVADFFFQLYSRH